jgi:effector-binding domain-containing protein
MTDHLIPIGRFSTLCRLSAKTLRYYDEVGLISPALVDQTTGYRYYGTSQILEVERVRVLRELEMPIDDIRRFLAERNRAVLRDMLALQERRLSDRMDRLRSSLEFLRKLVDREEEIMTYPIGVKEVPEIRVAGVRYRANAGTIGELYCRTYTEILDAVRRSGGRMAAPPMLVYHACDDSADDWDVETCVPVEGEVVPSGNVRILTLPACTAAYTIHVGPYTELAGTWTRLTEWIRERGHEFAGPARDIYLSDPGQTGPADLRTEIQWPIR